MGMNSVMGPWTSIFLLNARSAAADTRWSPMGDFCSDRNLFPWTWSKIHSVGLPAGPGEARNVVERCHMFQRNTETPKARIVA